MIRHAPERAGPVVSPAARNRCLRRSTARPGGAGPAGRRAKLSLPSDSSGKRVGARFGLGCDRAPAEPSAVGELRAAGRGGQPRGRERADRHGADGEGRARRPHGLARDADPVDQLDARGLPASRQGVRVSRIGGDHSVRHRGRQRAPGKVHRRVHRLREIPSEPAHVGLDRPAPGNDNRKSAKGTTCTRVPR